jgi:molecular chaperone Hsp33
MSQHTYPAPLRQLLGEALCVAGLLSAIIKFTGRLTVQFRGNGKLKLLLAQCDHHFHLRGLAKWDGELTYLELMEALNEGVLVITLDSGTKKGRYQGIVSWRGNSLTESIEAYFKESEQLATKISLAVDEYSAAGLLLQVIPGGDKQMTGIEKAIADPHWRRLTGLASALQAKDMLRIPIDTLLRQLYPNEEIRIFPPVPFMFQCTCTRQHGKDAIALLGKAEAEEELKDNQVINVTCDFCNKEYTFDRVDVAEIFAGKDQSSSDTHLH